MTASESATTRSVGIGGEEPSERTEPTVTPRRPVRPEPTEGQTLGRYTLQQRLGAGGMGVVFRAHDQRLDRPVAIKVLRTSRAGSEAEWTEGRARLSREAQAMAQLSHPHVVEVFDVGTEGGDLYVAMELIDGQTLRAWLSERARPWRAVVAMLMQAGRGLAAAHEAGLVHRDFKPANVIVDRQEHARVLDFGLALPTVARRSKEREPVPSMESSGPNSPTATDRLSSPVTEVGVVLGTPAYMAPEQHLGGDVGPPADQYALCCALYEALYGQRPFSAATTAELVRAKHLGEVPPPPKGHPVPVALYRTLVRGLKPRPEDRWPSVDALLGQLSRHTKTGRWRWPVAAGGVALAGGALVLALAGDEPTAQTDSACEVARARMQPVWNDAAAQALRTTLQAEPGSFATDTAARVEQRLGEYVERWHAAHAQLCGPEASVPIDAAVLHSQLDCLERRRRRLESLVTLLRESGTDLLLQATSLASGLPGLERCTSSDPDGESLVLPDDPQLAAQVRAVHADLEEVQTLIDAGRYDDARTHLETLEQTAQSLGYAPLQARVGSWMGDALLLSGQLDAAEARFERTLHDAEAAGDDHLAAFVATRLVYAVGHRQGRPDEGLTWGRHAQALLQRAGAGSSLEADLCTNLGSVLNDAGRAEEAATELERAVQLWTELQGPDDLQTAVARNNLGIIYYTLGRYQDAVAEYQEVRRIREAGLGPNHPDIGVVLNNLANALSELGQQAEAMVLRRRVQEIWRASLGPEHPYVAAALNNLGNSAIFMGQTDEAIEAFEAAIAIRERTLGAEHPELATSLLNLGVTLGQVGRHEEGLAHLRRAHSILDRAMGEHSWTASCIAAIAEVQGRMKQLEPALAGHERALMMRRRLHGDQHPEVALSHRALGEVLEALGRLEGARDHLERALAVQAGGGVDPHELATTRFALARVLLAQGKDPDRAVTLAGQAQAGWADAPAYLDQERARLELWLAGR